MISFLNLNLLIIDLQRNVLLASKSAVETGVKGTVLRQLIGASLSHCGLAMVLVWPLAAPEEEAGGACVILMAFWTDVSWLIASSSLAKGSW